MSATLVVLTNCPDAESAERIAAALVEQQLAACVNRLPEVQSTFRWNGAIERTTEVPLLIKCTRERYADVEAAILAVHPHEIPEIIAIPAVAGFAPYLQWIERETRPTRRA